MTAEETGVYANDGHRAVPANEKPDAPRSASEQGRDTAALADTLDMAQTQLRIVNALSRNFLNVFLIGLKDETIQTIKLNGYVPAGLRDAAKKERRCYQSVVAHYAEERVHPDDVDAFLQALDVATVRDALRAQDEYTGHYRILDDDGEIHYFEYRYILMDAVDGEGADEVVAGFRNIDAIIEEEAKNREVLASALAAAEHSNRAKTNFLNNMSHDIRTPMNAIIGFTSLAAAHIDNKEQVTNYLAKIQTSSQHLLSLINDVLDMSRIESGKMFIEEADANLASIMHDLKTIVQSDVAAKRLDFFIDTVDITDEEVVCDKLRLNQVLLNLLSNAVKFTEPGGFVSVRIAQKAGAPTGFADYEFRVKDSGIGMSPDFVEHVFEAFERERSSTVSGIQGTGLGMAITKNIVDMMGGTIKVESELGKGTEFTVSLRFRTAENPVKHVPAPELSGLRALVADDDLHTCTSVAKMLTQIGMRADWTMYGSEAVHRAQFAIEQGDEYYAYIIDWLMPDMNGIETVRRIRRVIKEDVPIIVLTAYDWSDVEKEAREAGVTAFVAKPIFMSELRAVLTRPVSELESGGEGEGACGLARGSAQAPAQAERHYDYSGKRVLLVEDNELNREIALAILGETGMSIDCAVDGIEAVNTINEAPEGTYDLVLMDIQMPRMDGYTAAREIRTLPSNKKANIPIVAMTANAFDEDRRKSFECGMNGHIVKPFDMKSVAKVFDEIF